MKRFKNFVNNNKIAQKLIGSILSTSIIIGIAEIIGSIITLNLPIIILFIVILITNYFLTKKIEFKF